MQPHVMQDPATGTAQLVSTEEQHDALMSRGYIHPEEVRTENTTANGLNNNNS